MAVGICFSSSNHRAMEAEHVFELAVYADFHLSEEILRRFAKFLCSDDHILSISRPNEEVKLLKAALSDENRLAISILRLASPRRLQHSTRSTKSAKRDTETFFFPLAFPHQLACGLFGIEIPLKVI